MVREFHYPSGFIVPESLPDSKVSLIYGQMNEPPGARMRVGLSALTVAEYFREDLQQDVLLFIDNIFRFGRFGTSPGHISGEVQSTCPSVASVPAFIRETTENVSANLGYILGVWEQWRNNSDALVPSVNWVVPAPAVCTWAR